MATDRTTRAGFPPPARLVLALVFGVLAALATASQMRRDVPGTARDFTYFYRAGAAVAAGQTPYTPPVAVRQSQFDGVYAYPLPAAVVLTPLGALPVRAAAAVFVGAGFALLAYGLLALPTWRLLTLAGFGALWATNIGQWSPLLLGAALVPWAGFLLAAKPTIGAALFLWRPSWPALWGGLALVAVSFAILPAWPVEWLEAVRTHPDGGQYRAPLAMPGGVLVLAALLRWRQPEARLLLGMAMVPQNALFYDQLPLLFVARQWWSLAVLVVLSHAGRMWSASVYPPALFPDVSGRSTAWEPYMMATLYLPCLLMVLLRPNEGPASAWLERALARAPRWLRGRSAPVSA